MADPQASRRATNWLPCREEYEVSEFGSRERTRPTHIKQTRWPVAWSEKVANPCQRDEKANACQGNKVVDLGPGHKMATLQTSGRATKWLPCKQQN